MKIAVIGLGYVGLPLALLLAKNNEVHAMDIDEEKIALLSKKHSPLPDPLMKKLIQEEELHLYPTLFLEEAIKGAEYVVVALPTDYDPSCQGFNTNAVKEVIRNVIAFNKDAVIIIKSTLPLGFTDALKKELGYSKIVVSPEFLKESTPMEDTIHPSRIIFGFNQDDHVLATKVDAFAKALKAASGNQETPILYMPSTEAEAVKLFANTYLALRISYFNELDSYALSRGLDTKAIIEGVCLDPRIGDFYNNPSFGYGGYCLPKDTKELLNDFGLVPQNLIASSVSSNMTRKEFISEEIAKRASNSSRKRVGIYLLGMEKGASSFRNSSLLDIANNLLEKGLKVVVYEPAIKERTYKGLPITNDFDDFVSSSGLIITNRWHEELKPYADKVFTRDIKKHE